MTIRLKTMLLPTGQYALVGEYDGTVPLDEQYMATIAAFRERIGAVAGLIASEPIEVEDALVDENAVFTLPEEDVEETDEVLDETDLKPFMDVIDRDVKELADLAGLPSPLQYYFPNVRVHVGDQEIQNVVKGKLGELSKPMSLKFTAEPVPFEFGGPVPDDATEFSPAGLVKNGTATKAQLEPELEDALSGNLSRGGPKPGKTDSGAVEAGPEPGDVVRVVKINGQDLGESPHEGQIGTVTRRQACWFDNKMGWRISLHGPDGGDVVASEVEPVEVTGGIDEDGTADFNDLDLLQDFAPDYAADTRLVDLVVKVSQAVVENYTSPIHKGMQFFRNGNRIVNDPWRRYITELLNNGGVNTEMED